MFWNWVVLSKHKRRRTICKWWGELGSSHSKFACLLNPKEYPISQPHESMETIYHFHPSSKSLSCCQQIRRQQLCKQHFCKMLTFEIQNLTIGLITRKYIGVFNYSNLDRCHKFMSMTTTFNTIIPQAIPASHMLTLYALSCTVQVRFRIFHSSLYLTSWNSWATLLDLASLHPKEVFPSIGSRSGSGFNRLKNG